MQGGIFRIRHDKNGKTAFIDQNPIRGYFEGEFIEKLIQPLMEELNKKIYRDLNGTETSERWTNGLPGVTKIKIQKNGTYMIRYTIQHKMGRDGGKNYHIQGHFTQLEKPKNQ